MHQTAGPVPARLSGLVTEAPVETLAEILLPPRGPARAGRGELVVVADGGRDRQRSVVSRAYATSPLRWLLPTNHGHAAWVFSSSYGGGLVDGDALSLDIDVRPGATALVSTQASTKVYRSPRGTSVDTRARIASGGLLVLLPDPVVCFTGSGYRQVQRIDVAEDAGLVLLDWVSSGRRTSGERWAFDEYVSRTIVHLGGRLVLHEALALRASDGDLAARFGRFDVLAIAVVLGHALRHEVASIVARLSERAPLRRAEQLLSVAPLGESGCVVRIAGRSVEQVGRTVRELLDFVPPLIGDDPWKRKW
jgi:urease accessory protein